MKPALTPEEIVRRYEAGQTIKQIASAARTNSNVIRYRLVSAGVKLRTTADRRAGWIANAKLTLAEISARYAKGDSVLSIATAAAITTSLVYAMLRDAGVTIRAVGLPKGRTFERTLTFAQRESLRADIRAGTFPSLTSIAKKYGISRELVRTYAKQEGVTQYTMALASKRTAERRAQVLARIAARKAARAAQIDSLSALWIAGASAEEIFQKTGFRNLLRCMYDLRNLYPDRFPYRNPNATKLARAQNAPARAEQAAALREKKLALIKEKAVFEEKLQQFATLWNADVDSREIARQTGFTDPAATASRYRKVHPERFVRRRARFGGDGCDRTVM